MKNLIKLFIRFRFLVYFIFLSLVCFGSMLQLRLYPGSVMLNGIWSVTDAYHQKETEFWSYFSLREENQKLKRELVQRNLACWQGSKNASHKTDSGRLNFECRPAEVVNITTDLTRNFITLNKGTADGFKMDQAVVSSEGIVGRIVGLSAHFSSVLPLINKESKVNCRLKKDGSFGSLGWNMESYRFAQLTDIPLNARIRQGDTVVTSALSSIFPEGMFVGTVYYYQRFANESFYTVKVCLGADFKRLRNVYALQNKQRAERDSLEQHIQAEYDR